MNSSWLFLGPEIGEKEEAINELRNKLTTVSKTPPEELHFYAGETPAGEILASLLNASLFADSRLFLVKNAENIKKKEEIELFVSYMAAPHENTVLILTSEENSIAKPLEQAGKRQVFYELLDNKKIEWIKNFFKNQGFTLNNDGIQTILELVENNTQALQQECSRLMYFLNKDEVIGPEEIEKCLSHNRQESAFSLFTRIAAGDFMRSLESLRVLLSAKESPQSILGGLLWCFRKLKDYLSLEEEGIRDEGEYRRIGIIGPHARRDYAEAARRYNSAMVENCIALTAEYDLKTRSANTFPDYILLDEYLYKVHFNAARS